MTEQEHLLVILSEECIETAQRVSKAIRFGLDEVQREQKLTNAQRIVYEFNDIVAVMEIMVDDGYLENTLDLDMIEAKKRKVKKYMKYAKKCGTIKANP